MSDCASCGHDHFVGLHNHCSMSAFDGLGTPEQFVKEAKRLGQPALAFTEHGTMRGLVESQKACDEHGIKLIPGIEAYLSDDMHLRGLTKEERDQIKSGYIDKEKAKAAVKLAEKERRDRDHITIWAMNDVGLKNLYRLTSRAWDEGYYYKPRLDIRAIQEHQEGLMVSSGCPGGIIPAALKKDDFQEAHARMMALADTFGDRYYVEIMPHVLDDFPDLQECLVEMAQAYGTKMLGTQDAHYPCRRDAAAQEVLLCIQVRQTMDDPDRFSQKAFGLNDFFLRSRKQMEAAFRSNTDLSHSLISQMLDETVSMSDRVDARFTPQPLGKYLASPALPHGVASHDEWLLNLSLEGFKRRFGVPVEDMPAKYLSRLEHEMGVFINGGFSPYMLMVWDALRFCRETGIHVGPGRGSSAGSLVCYLTGITGLDPVRYDLAFERFLAPGRTDLPDIDTDIQHDRRHELIEYLRARYGDDHVAHISTNIYLKGRRALRDTAKVYGVPLTEVEKVASMVVEATSEEDAGTSLSSVLQNTEAGMAFSEKYPDVAEVVLGIEGNVRNVGVHPAGIIVSSVPIVDVAPLETRAPSNTSADSEVGRTKVVAFDAHGCEAAGLVKADFLGLKTTSIISKAMAFAGITEDDISYEVDPAVLDAFSETLFGGIFQYDTPSARKLCAGFKFGAIDDVAALTALNRPGPLQTGDAHRYIRRAMGEEDVPSLHPVYDRIMGGTYGVLLYQEQIVALVRDLCGYSPEDADKFRKKVAKKTGVTDEHERFVAGAVASGMETYAAEKLFNDIVGFGSYAFGKAHAYVYAANAWQTMWLKVHHPGAFYAAYLSVRDEPENQMRLASEARAFGIAVEPPDVNWSDASFSLRSVDGKDVIVGAVKDIKGIGEKTAAWIASKAPFSSLLDFYEKTRPTDQDVDPGRVTARTFKCLAQTTALRSLCPNTRLLTENAGEIWELLKKGVDVQLDTEAVPDYPRDTLIRSAAELYRLYVDEGGRTEFAAVHEKVASLSKRPIYTTDEVPTDDPGSTFIMATLNNSKLFSDSKRGKSARVSLLSALGTEVSARVDSDVLERCANVISTKGCFVLALVSTGLKYGSGEVFHSVDALWDAEELLGGEPGDLLAAVVSGDKTNPSDPAARLQSVSDGQSFPADGLVVRISDRKQKNGAKMRVVGLLGEKSYVRFFVFSTRLERDALSLEVGDRISVRLEKLSGDAACLGKPTIGVTK